MIRLRRPLNGHTVAATVLVSLVAFTGCGGDSAPANTQLAAPDGAGVAPGPGDEGANSAPPSDSAASEQGAGDVDSRSNEGTADDLSLAPGEVEGEGASNEGEPPADTNCEELPLPSFEELQELRTLPDPFLGLNGERITSRAQWRCRRQEISRLAERFIYGENPPVPESVSGSISATELTVNVQNQGQSVSFSATVTLPPGATGPVPAIIAYGGSSFTDAILQEGVAVINYAVGPVGGQFDRNPKTGAFYAANPDFQATGTLLAWAWGVSRMIDVIEQSGTQIINPESVGVHGCSFAGKGAFIAGAFEERIALTIPYESGMSGVPAYRMIAPEGGEVLRNAYEWQPWAGDAYRQFLVLDATDQNDTAGRARDQQLSGELMYRLPVDTHEVIGMVAPRGLLVLGNPSIVNLAPRSEQVTTLAGVEIYSALGARENISYMSRTDNPNHCAFRQEYVPILQQSIRKFLKSDPNAETGSLDPAPQLGGELAPNIAWDTPTLE